MCEECARHGRTTIGRIADHIIPLTKDGSGKRSNYQLLCVDCDRAKQLADKGIRSRKRAVGKDGWPA